MVEVADARVQVSSCVEWEHLNTLDSLADALRMVNVRCGSRGKNVACHRCPVRQCRSRAEWRSPPVRCGVHYGCESVTNASVSINTSQQKIYIVSSSHVCCAQATASHTTTAVLCPVSDGRPARSCPGNQYPVNPAFSNDGNCNSCATSSEWHRWQETGMLATISSSTWPAAIATTGLSQGLRHHP